MKLDNSSLTKRGGGRGGGMLIARTEVQEVPPEHQTSQKHAAVSFSDVEVPGDIGLEPICVRKTPRYTKGRFPSGNAALLIARTSGTISLCFNSLIALSLHAHIYMDVHLFFCKAKCSVRSPRTSTALCLLCFVIVFCKGCCTTVGIIVVQE